MFVILQLGNQLQKEKFMQHYIDLLKCNMQKQGS